MRSSARIDVIGHLGSAAELKYLQDGTALLSFSVANTPYVKAGAEEHTNWYRCSFFGSRAANVADLLDKGSAVHVRGDLDIREYTDRDGARRTSLDIRVTELDLLGSKNDQTQPAAAGTRKAAPARTTTPLDDNDIPF